jgi:GxxExxY protein
MKPTSIPRNVDALAREAVDAAYHVHRELGPGLLETAYRQCLAYELTSRGIPLEQEKLVPVVYRGLRIDAGFRSDLVLADSLLIELKAVEALLPVHEAQIITYLKILNLPLGLLINFNVPLIKLGIHRKLNLSYGQPGPSTSGN